MLRSRLLILQAVALLRFNNGQVTYIGIFKNTFLSLGLYNAAVS